jgi:hypothetical protein
MISQPNAVNDLHYRAMLQGCNPPMMGDYRRVIVPTGPATWLVVWELVEKEQS